MAAAAVRPNEREAEIDGKLAAIWNRAREADRSLDGTVDGLARAIGARKAHTSKHSYRWVKNGEFVEEAEIVAAAREVAATEKPLSEYGSYGAINFSPASYWLDERDSALAEIEACKAEAAPLNTLYEAERWSRFFLVTSSAGGHIHSSMHCSTCRWDTGFAWLPDLSGLTEKDAVDAHGAILCTVCFPSAPVEWTNAHEVAAAEREAAKCPGSGEYAPAEALTQRRRYAHCPHCGYYASITSTGKLRGHKPEAK